jgi:hypothetical protein
MSTYLVLITPDESDGPARAQTTVRVETSPVPRITEISVVSTGAEGLSTQALPVADLDAVLHALASGVQQRDSRSVSAANGPSSPPMAEPAREAAGQRKAAAGLPAVTDGGKADRPYRHMPDAEEVKRVYESVGSVTALAKHYEVPRHTAQGWMNRLRKASE